MRRKANLRQTPDPTLPFFWERISFCGPPLKMEWKDENGESGTFWLSNVDGGVLHYDGTDSIYLLDPTRSLTLLLNGVAPRLRSLANRYTNSFMFDTSQFRNVINIGAFIGELAIVFESEQTRVIAVEPDPKIARVLRLNAEGRNILVEEAAVWDRDGEVTLFLDSETANSSIINEAHDSTVVRGMTIDSIVRKHGVDVVDLLIGDVEGAEPEALKGAGETLKKTRYVALSGSKERRGEATQDDCIDILKSNGFEIIYKEEGGYRNLIGKNTSLS